MATMKQQPPSSRPLPSCRRRYPIFQCSFITYLAWLFALQFLWTYLFLKSRRLAFPWSRRLNLDADSVVDKEQTTNARPRLRLNWGHLEHVSDLARRMQAHQSNCHVPLGNFRYRNRFGLGSDLHVYSQALCNALEASENKVRLRTLPDWIWLDQSTCQSASTASSSMVCYFPNAELQCPGDATMPTAQLVNVTAGRGRVRDQCPELRKRYGVSAIRAATTEFLFARVGQPVINEAQRQLVRIFGGRPPPPDHLITVHIRWGDKVDEMKLLDISEYIRAVQTLARKRRDDDATVNVFLATEDPRAVSAFQSRAPDHWNIYLDAYFDDFLSHRRNDTYNGSPLMAQDLKGRPGLVALASLLVAMEANDFVLTTASNWSRLINELRLNVVNPRCDNCTNMIDLKRGEW